MDKQAKDKEGSGEISYHLKDAFANAPPVE